MDTYRLGTPQLNMVSSRNSISADASQDSGAPITSMAAAISGPITSSGQMQIIQSTGEAICKHILLRDFPERATVNKGVRDA